MVDDHEMEESNPNSIVVEVNEEDHTFGNLLSHVMWTHPHITVAQYYQDSHYTKGNQILLHCQTQNEVSAEQGMVEALDMTRQMFSSIGGEMEEATKRWEMKQKNGKKAV